MPTPPKYNWPETQGLVKFVKVNGLRPAATKLGVKPSTLSAHLIAKGVSPEEYRPEPKELNADALKEIQALLNSD